MDNDRLKIKQLVLKLSNKYGLSAKEIEELVNSPYHFTYDKLKDLEIEHIESEEEANSLKSNFNYKGLGKLYLSYPALVARKKRKNNASLINNKKWKNK